MVHWAELSKINYEPLKLPTKHSIATCVDVGVFLFVQTRRSKKTEKDYFSGQYDNTCNSVVLTLLLFDIKLYIYIIDI